MANESPIHQDVRVGQLLELLTANGIGSFSTVSPTVQSGATRLLSDALGISQRYEGMGREVHPLESVRFAETIGSQFEAFGGMNASSSWLGAEDFITGFQTGGMATYSDFPPELFREVLRLRRKPPMEDFLPWTPPQRTRLSQKQALRAWQGQSRELPGNNIGPKASLVDEVLEFLKAWSQSEGPVPPSSRHPVKPRFQSGGTTVSGQNFPQKQLANDIATRWTPLIARSFQHDPLLSFSLSESPFDSDAEYSGMDMLWDPGYVSLTAAKDGLGTARSTLHAPGERTKTAEGTPAPNGVAQGLLREAKERSTSLPNFPEAMSGRMNPLEWARAIPGVRNVAWQANSSASPVRGGQMRRVSPHQQQITQRLRTLEQLLAENPRNEEIARLAEGLSRRPESTRIATDSLPEAQPLSPSLDTRSLGERFEPNIPALVSSWIRKQKGIGNAAPYSLDEIMAPVLRLTTSRNIVHSVPDVSIFTLDSIRSTALESTRMGAFKTDGLDKPEFADRIASRTLLRALETIQDRGRPEGPLKTSPVASRKQEGGEAARASAVPAAFLRRLLSPQRDARQTGLDPRPMPFQENPEERFAGHARGTHGFEWLPLVRRSNRLVHAILEGIALAPGIYQRLPNDARLDSEVGADVSGTAASAITPPLFLADFRPTGRSGETSSDRRGDGAAEASLPAGTFPPLSPVYASVAWQAGLGVEAGDLNPSGIPRFPSSDGGRPSTGRVMGEPLGNVLIENGPAAEVVANDLLPSMLSVGPMEDTRDLTHRAGIQSRWAPLVVSPAPPSSGLSMTGGRTWRGRIGSGADPHFLSGQGTLSRRGDGSGGDPHFPSGRRTVSRRGSGPATVTHPVRRPLSRPPFLKRTDPGVGIWGGKSESPHSSFQMLGMPGIHWGQGRMPLHDAGAQGPLQHSSRIPSVTQKSDIGIPHLSFARERLERLENGMHAIQAERIFTSGVENRADETPVIPATAGLDWFSFAEGMQERQAHPPGLLPKAPGSGRNDIPETGEWVHPLRATRKEVSEVPRTLIQTDRERVFPRARELDYQEISNSARGRVEDSPTWSAETAIAATALRSPDTPGEADARGGKEKERGTGKLPKELDLDALAQRLAGRIQARMTRELERRGRLK